MTVDKVIIYDVFNEKGEIFDNCSIKLKILEYSGNYLIHKDILRHQIFKRQGTVSTKTKSEVRGGGRKPWKQKGTGNARAGSSRSPLWRGGGVIFGPKPKKATFKFNKKERKLAIKTLLFNKHKSTILMDDSLENWSDYKTSNILDLLKNLNIEFNKKILIVVSTKTNSLFLCTRNIKNITLISSKTLNTMSLLKNKFILITQSAFNDIKEIYCD